MMTPVREYERGDRICKIEGCGKTRDCHGTYCQMHQKRQSRHGDVGETERERSVAGQSVWDTPAYRRRYLLLTTYGMTSDEYDRMLASQDGKCAICGTDDPQSARNNVWNVDHDHDTGEVRGLLCSPCNRGMGLLQDNPKVIEKVLQYLQRPRLSLVKDA
jgi:hypothetical protein